MLDLFNTPTPQRSNYQEFYGGGTVCDWVKPRGVAMVRMLIIGAGAGGRTGSTGAGGAGGGSGAFTSWIGPAIFIPDILRISLGAGGASGAAGGNTTVIYLSNVGTGVTLLTANGAASQTAGTASTNNYFGASGIFKSVAGQSGSAGTIPVSTTTFLSGGAGGSNTDSVAGSNVNTQYNYPTLSGGAGTTGGTGGSGYFLTQPIMFGAGGAGGGGSTTAAGGTGGKGGIGCGGGGGGICTSGTSLGGQGGDGAAFIWSW